MLITFSDKALRRLIAKNIQDASGDISDGSFSMHFQTLAKQFPNQFTNNNKFIFYLAADFSHPLQTQSI
jgi:hypothetical protein